MKAEETVTAVEADPGSTEEQVEGAVLEPKEVTLPHPPEPEGEGKTVKPIVEDKTDYKAEAARKESVLQAKFSDERRLKQANKALKSEVEEYRTIVAKLAKDDPSLEIDKPVVDNTAHFEIMAPGFEDKYKSAVTDEIRRSHGAEEARVFDSKWRSYQITAELERIITNVVKKKETELNEMSELETLKKKVATLEKVTPPKLVKPLTPSDGVSGDATSTSTTAKSGWDLTAEERKAYLDKEMK